MILSSQRSHIDLTAGAHRAMRRYGISETREVIKES